MSSEKEIQKLHNRGFVILRAARTTNAPIGWKRKVGDKKKWGYVEEMNDPFLSIYKSTFFSSILSRSHCGFYLGHGDLCCIDLDTKKITGKETSALKDKIIGILNNQVAVERTKSNGFHIYFLYKKREPIQPDWTQLHKANWIELYYSKRFIACYLSNSKKYTLEHGSILDLKPLTLNQHKKLIGVLLPFKGKEQKQSKTRKAFPVDDETWKRAETYTKQLENKGLDITGDNPTWFKIGKAFANAFGQKGFDMFNRVSQFSSTYNEDTIESDFTRFVNEEAKPKGKKITIGSFFKICEDFGLQDLETIKSLQLHPPAEKEFELVLTKRESMAEHVHTLVESFLKHVEICCLDSANFYIFEHTHWIRRNQKQVVDLINNFVDRSDVDDRFRKKLRTLPYLDMALRELKLITMQDVIEPRTGNLNEGIFINMENGILHINMKTGKRKLLDHESSYNFTTILPYCYEPTASCPKFDTWLNAQVLNKDNHAAYFAFVASCLTKHKADIIMLLAGETSTGKSSLIDITRRVIGIDNSAAISAGILFSGTAEAQTQAMQMENKLLAYDFDSQPFKHLEMLLKVAAQEPLPGWQMHVTRRPVVNYGRLLIAMNPYNYSVFNAAVARRLITINMDVPVIKDNAIIPMIYENELPGIFNHVLNIGVKHLLQNGGQIRVTDNMKKATLDFHTRQRDSIRWFEEKYCILKPSTDKGNKFLAKNKLQSANPLLTIRFTSISELYTEFRTWLEDIEGWHPNKLPIRRFFAADLKMIGLEDILIKMEKNDVKRGCFIGTK